MNFFGHAAIAVHFTDEPSFVLGAMLPDFSNMIAARPPPVRHETLAAGVRFHHATDEVFHELAPFLELSRAAFGFLSERGLRRGTARAVAHVGVELLIDEALAGDRSAELAYLSALNVTRSAAIDEFIDWRMNERERFAFLIERLTERGITPAAHARHVAERLRRILESRPRLAFSAEESSIVEDWIVQARPIVVASAPALTEDLIAKLRVPTAGPPAARP